MIKRRKDKGFTLIELLITIVIVSLVTTIATLSVSLITKSAKNKKNEITISTIKKSASQYTEEFKNLDKYWFGYSFVNDNEYVCTTVGMLINKGFLKKDIIGTELEVETPDGKHKKKVEESTSIKIERNKNTKVYNNNSIEFESSECGESAEIDLNFDVIGKNSNCDSYQNKDECPYKNWYNQDVIIKINSTNSSQIQDVTYSENVNGTGEKIISNTNIKETSPKTSDWKIEVGTQGKSIDICVNVIDLKDKNNKFCLSDDNGKYNMDKEKPNTPTLNLINNNAYKLLSNESKDNVTPRERLVYHLSENNNTNLGSYEYIIPNGTRYENGKDIDTFTIDEAGNKSDIITKNLMIKNSQNGEQSSKYYCSLDADNDVIYDSYELAVKSCTNRIIEYKSEEKTIWTCVINNTKLEFDNFDEAEEKCTKIEKGSKVTTYSCDRGDSRNYTICTKKQNKTVSGWKEHTLVCSGTPSLVWKQDSTKNESSNNGCGDPSDGFTRDNFSCGDWQDLGKPCSTFNITKTERVSCTNYCSKTTTYYAHASCTCEGETYNCNDTCNKQTKVEPKDEKKYICSELDKEYYDKNEAELNCKKEISGIVSSEHWCSLTGKKYSTETEAQEACENYCSEGSYFNNACYDLK